MGSSGLVLFLLYLKIEIYFMNTLDNGIVILTLIMAECPKMELIYIIYIHTYN